MRTCFLAAAIAGAISIHAQTPAPSVGDILLLSSSSDAAVPATLRDALLSTDPAVRRVAGRVAAVSGRSDVRPILIGAIARERDVVAGAELIRDILHLSGAADLAFVEPQARRLGGPALLALAAWFARMQPDDFADRLPALAATDAHAAPGLVATAVLQHPERAERILRSWMAVTAVDGWTPVLAAAFGGMDIDASAAALIIDALNAPQAHVREETVWFVLAALGAKRKAPANVIDAAGAPREGAAAWEAFGRELITRRGRPPAGPDRHELIETQGRAHMADLYGLDGAPQLTAAERSAALALAPNPREPFADADLTVALARTTAALTPGAIASTLRAADCHASSSGIARALVVYSPDGFPRHLTVNPSGLSPQCQAAWIALARTTAADEAEPVRAEGQTLMLPFNADFITCADAAAEPQVAAPRATPTSKITQPRKIKDVKPLYPDEALSRRIQGVVVLKGIVSRGGCVSSLRLLRSLPYLDAPAMAAVAGWRYEPTLLDGVPVSVVMTVTVNFALQ